MNDSERIANLETIVRELVRQVNELRVQVAALHGSAPAAASVPIVPAPAAPVAPPSSVAAAGPAPLAASLPPAAVPSAPTPRPTPPPRQPTATLDLEALLGRYGTIALATLVILMGVGAFLTWAVAHGLLGPGARVVLGAIAAAAVAVTGWRLRRRGTVRFGSTLLALALAIVHVDAWAAGPRLGVVSAPVALGIAALASAALAVLARAVGDEMLFDVGLAGALLAPFVTSEGGGTAGQLALYGWVVIAGGMVATRDRVWRVALLIGGLGCIMYAATVDSLARAALTWPGRHLPSLFALACAWTALVLPSREMRGRLALALLGVLVWTQLTVDADSARVLSAVLVALGGTATAYIALAVDASGRRWREWGTIVLPLAFLATAVIALRLPVSEHGARIAAVWGAVALGAAWGWRAERGRHLVAGALTTATAIILASYASPEWCIGALAAHAVVFAALMRLPDGRPLATPVAIDLVVASGWALVQLADRTPYRYPPFLTAASASALAVVAAWWIFRWASHREIASGRAPVALAELLDVMPVLAAFVWIREELVGAFAADTATFLVIVYYAAAGVAAIAHGRRRKSGGARGIGLALAFYAGIKALMQAWGLSNIALRVGSFILVGLFMALVSYWYRVPDVAAPEAPAAPQA